MATVSRKGMGKTIQITISAFRNGNANPETNLTITDSGSHPKLKTTLTEAGLKKFKAHVLGQFKKLILDQAPVSATSRPTTGSRRRRR